MGNLDSKKIFFLLLCSVEIFIEISVKISLELKNHLPVLYFSTLQGEGFYEAFNFSEGSFDDENQPNST